MPVFYAIPVTYSVSGKIETKMYFVISLIKLGRFWWNLVHSFRNKFGAKTCKHFPPHLSNVYTTLWNLKCSSFKCYHRVVIETLRIYSASTAAYKLARFESSWLQSVRNIAREGVQNTHHWSGHTETSWIMSSLWHHSSRGVVDSSRSLMHVLSLSLAIFPHTNLANLEAIVEVG